MSKKASQRMRVFAGPNGSGKSTIIKEIQKLVTTGAYINADDIEKACRDKGFVNLGDYGLSSTESAFTSFLQDSTLLAKATEEGFEVIISFSNNIIKVNQQANSYAAALIADFLRNLLLNQGETFSFETVMSHESKLEMFKRSRNAGFKNYLYFISTESADINVARVAARVNKGGHAVSEQKIKERYVRSMELLASIIPYCYRCFVIDNSDDYYRLVLEIVNGTTIEVVDSNIPAWVETYVLDKFVI